MFTDFCEHFENFNNIFIDFLIIFFIIGKIIDYCENFNNFYHIVNNFHDFSTDINIIWNDNENLRLVGYFCDEKLLPKFFFLEELGYDAYFVQTITSNSPLSIRLAKNT